MFFYIEEAKGAILDFFPRNRESIIKLFCFYIFQYKMTQYNTLNVTFFNLQINKLKSRQKNGAKVTLNFSSNAVGDSNDKAVFSHKYY